MDKSKADKAAAQRQKMNQVSSNDTHSVPASGGLESDLQAHIGRQLRAVYDEVVNEPVPDRFLKLLQELDRKQGKP